MAGKDAGDGTTFSMRQMVMMLTAAIALSGGGAVGLVSASDAVQNEKIQRVEEAVKNLRSDLTETRDAVIVMVPQIENIEDDVSEIRRDLKEILKAVAEGD